MKINVTQPCPHCLGHKLQMHSSWVEWYAQRRHTTEEQFFLDLGYLPDEEWPPLAVPCSKCRGEGEVEAWVPMEVLLPNLVGLIREVWKGQAA